MRSHPPRSDNRIENEPTVADSLQREWRALRALAPYLWREGRRDLKIRVILALLCLACAKGAMVLVPLAMRAIVDHLSPVAGGGDAQAVALTIPVGLIVAYGLVRLASAVFQELREALFVRVAQHAIRTVALQIFRHLHQLPLAFHLARQTGGLSRMIERGVKGIEFLLSFMLFNILPTLLEIALVCGVLWALFDAYFALVTFITVASYIVFTAYVTEWRLKFRKRMNETDQSAHNRAVDSLLNYETVKYFTNEEIEAQRFDHSLKGYERAAVQSLTSLSIVNIGQGAIITIGLVVLMIMAADRLQQGSMTIGDFILVNSYLIQLYMPLNFLGFVYRQIRQSLTDMDDMFQLLAITPAIADPVAPKAFPPQGTRAQGLVEFDAVSFAYDPARPILKNISFQAAPGETIAIVGPSGAGKSTISRLLFRFYDVSGGAIRIDGLDIRDIGQDDLRRQVAVVPQDTVLFNDDIGYNIRYGAPASDEAAVFRAAEMAQIANFIASLPDGYATQVGERGLKLSGGEKQRVSIARAILKDPAIMVFDEATSALDTETERDIQKSLTRLAQGRTTIIIAHRLSTIVDADRILVLQAGRLVEQGTHQQLLACQGLYAQMWGQQQKALA